jgi:hypothetical protein
MKKLEPHSNVNRRRVCRHDYKNAIQVGNVDYVCPLCKELLDPMEWFFMNSFEFIDVTVENKMLKGKITKNPKKLKGKENDKGRNKKIY